MQFPVPPPKKNQDRNGRLYTSQDDCDFLLSETEATGFRLGVPGLLLHQETHHQHHPPPVPIATQLGGRRKMGTNAGSCVFPVASHVVGTLLVSNGICSQSGSFPISPWCCSPLTPPCCSRGQQTPRNKTGSQVG